MNAMLNAILGFATNSFWMPERSSSTVSADVDGLYYFIYYLSLFFFFLITFFLVAFIIKYRHREGGKPHEPAAGHSTALELTWTIIPTVLLLVVFYYGFRGFLDMMVEPPNSYEVLVTGKQWNWTFTYEGQYVSDDGNLHIPVNTPSASSSAPMTSSTASSSPPSASRKTSSPDATTASGPRPPKPVSPTSTAPNIAASVTPRCFPT
jgi:hypothetical protein